MSWRKSSFTGATGSACVEVGRAVDAVLVRDTKNRTGGTGQHGFTSISLRGARLLYKSFECALGVVPLAFVGAVHCFFQTRPCRCVAEPPESLDGGRRHHWIV